MEFSPPALKLRRGSLRGAKAGGAEGSRTPDLLIANETLYQLSYDPIQSKVPNVQKYAQIWHEGKEFWQPNRQLLR